MDIVKYLGKQHSDPVEALDCVPSPRVGIFVSLNCSEFTSHCPVTKQPDFANVKISYQAREHIVETKSLKLWLWRWRDKMDFNEKIACDIAELFYEQVKPFWVEVSAQFNARGGISVCPTVSIGEKQ